MEDLGFTHLFVPAPESHRQGTLLTLHGSGGNENDLIPLAHFLAPGYNVLSPRGRILENGMPRFFRRVAEGVFDLADLKYRTGELARFIEQAAKSYAFAPDKVLAVGYSNGANIAASLLLLHPRSLAGAILFRPQMPMEPEVLPRLSSIPILISSGSNDSIVPPQQVERLAHILKGAGADVTLCWEKADHAIASKELHDAKSWLEKNQGRLIA